MPNYSAGRMVALGFVLEHPDETMARYALLMNERLPRSFPGSTVYNSLKAMANQGLVKRTYQAPEGERSQDRFEGQPKGNKVFEQWLRARGTPLELKDSLRGRLAFIALDNLPAYLAIVRLEKSVCKAEYGEACFRAKHHDEMADDGLESKLTAALLIDEAEIWRSRETRLVALLKYLETIGVRLGLSEAERQLNVSRCLPPSPYAPGSMVALGLVVDNPDMSVAHYAFLMDQCRERGFPSTDIYGSLRTMTGKGLLELTYKAPEGERSLDRLRARQEGIDTFERWRRTVPPPVELKDSLRGRLVFLSLARLPVYIRAIELELSFCNAGYQAAAQRLADHEAKADSSLESDLAAALLIDDSSIWQSREHRLERVLEHLKSLGGGL